MAQQRRGSYGEDDRHVTFEMRPPRRASTMPVMPNTKPPSAGIPPSDRTTNQPLASVAAVIEAYEAGKRFNAGPLSTRDQDVHNMHEQLRRVRREFERGERRKQQQQPTVEEELDVEDEFVEESVRSESPHRERDARRERERSREREAPREYPEYERRGYSGTQDRRTRSKAYPAPYPIFQLSPAEDEDDPTAMPYSYDYELPAQYLKVSQVDFGNGSTTVTTDELLSRPIDGVTALAISKARWTTRNAATIGVDLEATAKRSGPADFWVHIQRPANSFATLQTVVQSSAFLSERERTQAHTFLKKIQQDHEHETELGCVLDPGAVFCENNETEKEGVALRFLAFSQLQSRKASVDVAKRGHVHPSLPFTEIRDSRNEDEEDKSSSYGRHGKQNRENQIELTPTWILLIGRRCIITCNNHVQADMAGNRMNLTIYPSKTSRSEGLGSASQVRVTYFGRAWTVPLEHCRSWPALWATFTKAFIERAWGLAFVHESVVLDATRWENLQRQITTGVIKLRLVKRNDQRVVGSVSVLQQELEIVRAIKGPSSESPGNTSDAPTAQIGFGRLMDASPLIQLLEGVATPSTGSKAPSTVADDLHSLLTNNPYPLIKSTYTNFKGATRSQFLDEFRKAAAEQGNDDFVKTKCRLTAHAYYLYTFFWAWDSQHIVVSRFWDALCAVCRSKETGEGPWLVENVLGCLSRTLFTAIWISDTFRTNVNTISVAAILPDLVKAWLHLQTGLMLLSEPLQLIDGREDSYSATSQHFSLLSQCLDRADEAIGTATRVTKIREHEVCGTSGLACLFLSSLTSDKLDEGLSVVQIYRQLLDQMAPVVAKRGQRRQLHDDLMAIKHELRCLESVNSVHREMILQAMLAKYPDFKINEDAAKPRVGSEDRRFILMTQAWDRCRIRADRLDNLKARARSLANRYERRQRSSKDRREMAIYIFTVVTVIFLPLSFVSSVFGMNTNDIRNMDQNQWLYWAVALPVTVIVVVLCLVLAGILRLTSSASGDQDDDSVSSYASRPIVEEYYEEEYPTKKSYMRSWTRPERPYESYRVYDPYKTREY